MLNPLWSILRTLAKNRRLLMEMAKRDLSDRYSGQILGMAWSFIHPVATIGVFLFIFGAVFQAKAANVGVDFPADHAVYMVSGLIPWLVVAEVMSRATASISGQAALVKQVVFPLEILPVKMVMATLPTMIIGFAGLTAYAAIRFGTLPASYLMLPAAAAILYVFLIGVAFMISAIAVFFRDLKDIVQLYTLLGLYLAPIFYFIDWIPESLRIVVYLNPIAYFIMIFHDLAYYGTIQSPSAWGAATALSLLSAVLGALLFSRLKPHFGSYL